MEKRKLFIVKFKIGRGRDFSEVKAIKAFADRLSAAQCAESEIKKLLKDRYDSGNGRWIDSRRYRYENAMRCEDCSGEDRVYDYLFEIEEVDAEQDIAWPEAPSAEKENLALKRENSDLRLKLERAEGLIAAAKCYLTMWDGGRECDREHVLENARAALAVLQGGESGNDKIIEMFEQWLARRNGK